LVSKTIEFFEFLFFEHARNGASVRMTRVNIRAEIDVQAGGIAFANLAWGGVRLLINAKDQPARGKQQQSEEATVGTL
jgi:hypothetical protein